MAKTAFKGTPVTLAGEFVKAGTSAPEFTLVKGDLSNYTLKDGKGKYLILNIFPSMDTGVCATSVRKFNQLAANQPNTVVLAISKDLPFAQGRFCTTEMCIRDRTYTPPPTSRKAKRTGWQRNSPKAYPLSLIHI